MDKHFKIVERIYLPQIFICSAIILLYGIILILNNSFFLITSSSLIAITAISLVVISLVAFFFPSRKKIGQVKFDSFCFYLNIGNSSEIGINYLDEKLEKMRLKLAYTRSRFEYGNYHLNRLNKFELIYNGQKNIYWIELDNYSEFQELKNILKKIDEKARIISN